MKVEVFDHVRSITLDDVTFVVQPAGNARVREEGRKNVHAFARGHIIFHRQLDMSNLNQNQVTYDPYRYTSFVDTQTRTPVHQADYAVLTSRYNHSTNSYTPCVDYHDHVKRG
jgi:hypothetical protein